MTRTEALALAAQLGVTMTGPRLADQLVDLCKARGMEVGLDQVTGDWVVLGDQGCVYARCT